MSFDVAGGSITYRLEVATQHPQALDSSYSGMGVVVGAEIGGGGEGNTPPEDSFWQETIQRSVAGKSTYWIPLGWYYRADPQDVEVAVSTDGGQSWTSYVQGVDYDYKKRVTAPPTVEDLAIGVVFTTQPPAVCLIRIRWRVRRLLIDPPPIAKVYLTNGSPDYTATWYSRSGYSTVCNGVRVPSVSGYQVEFWRLTKRNGGLVSEDPHPGVPRRQGRRFIPYFRGSVDKWLFHLDEFRAPGNANKRWRYRLCYVNPNTGARSPLSKDVVVVNQGRAERCGSNPAERMRRSDWSVWIE